MITLTQKITFNYNNLKTSLTDTGFSLNWNQQYLNVQTEYLNPYKCEGYATIWIQVDGKGYQRTFEESVPDIRLINFVTKFINDENYREAFKNKVPVSPIVNQTENKHPK